MLQEVFLFVIVVHCFGASKNAEANSEEDSVSSTSAATPEIKERFFGLDDIFNTILTGPSYNPGLGFGRNQLNTPYFNQQYPPQSHWQNMQTPQHYPNMGQDFSQQANFAQYPSQNGYGVWNGQIQKPVTQQGSWQNVPRPQRYPNKGQDFIQQANFDQYPSQNGYGVWNGQNQNPVMQHQSNSQNVQTPQNGQNFDQQYPLQNQGNFYSGSSQSLDQNQNAQAQDDWSNAEAPQQFPSVQDFTQQFNSDQSPGNFESSANQNLNTGTIDNVPSQNGFQNQNFQNNGGNLAIQNFNTGTVNNIPSQSEFQDQNLEDDAANLAAIFGTPVSVVSDSEADRIVFKDEWV